MPDEMPLSLPYLANLLNMLDQQPVKNPLRAEIVALMRAAQRHQAKRLELPGASPALYMDIQADDDDEPPPTPKAICVCCLRPLP